MILVFEGTQNREKEITAASNKMKIITSLNCLNTKTKAKFFSFFRLAHFFPIVFVDILLLQQAIPAYLCSAICRFRKWVIGDGS